MTNRYTVIVGNIGTVYDGPSRITAALTYKEYRRQSLTGRGRAGGEDITLLCNDEPTAQHIGSLNDWEDRDGDTT